MFSTGDRAVSASPIEEAFTEEASSATEPPLAAKFVAVVGNPPYQRDTHFDPTKSPAPVDVFPAFQEVASRVAKRTCLLYPATWQRSLTEGLGHDLLQHYGLASSLTLRGEALFTTVKLPVTVVLTAEDYRGPLLVNGWERERGQKVWLDDEVSRLLVKHTEVFPKLSPPRYANRLNNAQESSLALQESAEGFLKPVKVLLKARPGKQADAKWFFVEEEALRAVDGGYASYGRFKVNMRSRVLGRQALFQEVVFTRSGGLGLQTRVFGPGEVTGLTWCELATFATEEEAVNFSAYMNTMVVAKLAYLDFGKHTFGSLIPDLEDYTDSNPHLRWREPLEEQLYRLFGLSARGGSSNGPIERIR